MKSRWIRNMIKTIMNEGNKYINIASMYEVAKQILTVTSTIQFVYDYTIIIIKNKFRVESAIQKRQIYIEGNH